MQSKPTVTLMCVPYSPQMKMDSSLTPTVRTCISIMMAAQKEGEGNEPLALAFVLDVSQSTNDSVSAEGGEGQIFKAIKAGTINTLNLMRDGDQITVIIFDDSGRVIMPLTKVNGEIREDAISAVDNNVYPQGGTNYASGLETAEAELAKVQGMKRAIAFISDGANLLGDDPLPIAQRLRDSGIVIYTAAVSDALKSHDETRLKEMSGGANFKACMTAFQVGKFFEASLRKAAHAAITNARLEFAPIGLVQAVNHIELVQKNGKRNYVAGNTDKPSVVQLGEVGPGDRLDVFVQFKTRLPNFPADLQSQERTFGALRVFGACSSMGITDPIELTSDEMRQRFAKVTSGKVNSVVEKIAALAETARALDQASKTTDAATQQKILGDAAAKVRRATQVFTDDEDLAGSLTDLEALRAESASKGGAATAKAAGRRTQVFTDDE